MSSTCAPTRPRLSSAPDLSFEFEYAAERNGEALDSDAWTLQGAYELSDVTWKPKLSYRYAFFQGDDPDRRQRSLRSAVPRLLRLGHLVAGRDCGRVLPVELEPEVASDPRAPDAHRRRRRRADVLQVPLDQPEAVGPEVTDTDVAFEVDAYVDWKLNANFTLSLVGAFADPGRPSSRRPAAPRTSPTGWSTSATASETGASSPPSAIVISHEPRAEERPGSGRSTTG